MLDDAYLSSFIRFNLRREAAPHATQRHLSIPFTFRRFQSQTRSRSTCDFVIVLAVLGDLLVSISDEKPLHMRRRRLCMGGELWRSFNLRREAAPHATAVYGQLQLHQRGVSISDEKPLHMRR